MRPQILGHGREVGGAAREERDQQAADDAL
jgi:hypothetical protein